MPLSYVQRISERDCIQYHEIRADAMRGSIALAQRAAGTGCRLAEADGLFDPSAGISGAVGGVDAVFWACYARELFKSGGFGLAVMARSPRAAN